MESWCRAADGDSELTVAVSCLGRQVDEFK